MGMTVKENVMMGALFRASRFNLNKNQIQNIVKNALDLVGLGEKADHPVEELNLAQRRVLEIARAIAMEPKLLLLDEAMAGLTPTEVQRLLDLVRTLNAQGMTVLLIEHVLKVVMNLSRRVLVLHYGRLIAEGSPQEIVNNPKVIEAYLGSKREGRIQGG
jgi:branched-chain amino acid transport system ATP-binding protein